MLTRRMLLAGVAPGAALVVAGCTSTQEAQFAQQWSNFIDQVTTIVSKGCGIVQGFIPTANTIEAIVSALYPAAAAAIAAGAAAVNSVASAICSAVQSAPPAALKRLRGAARGITPPAFVGNVVVNGKVVPVVGYGH